jgi:Phosphodiester glycosidase
VAAWLACHVAALLAGTTVSHPYAGITLTDRVETEPRAIHAHVAQIDLTRPGVHVALVVRPGPLEAVRQTTVDALRAAGAQLAVNVHFFLPFPSADPNASMIGVAASEGRWLSAFEVPTQTYAIVADAPGINVDRDNHASLIHARATPAGDGVVAEPVPVWTAFAGSAEIVTDGVVTIPEYRDDTHPQAALIEGGPNHYSNTRSWYAVVTARTAAGISRDGRTLTLFTVDARGGSAGMTVGEVADRLVRDYGAWQAINLDGGGSTSMALADPDTGQVSLINTSSDNPAGRAVASSLVVFAPGAGGR